MASIQAILLHDWDPIGVEDIPEAQDEYDSYIGGVYGLLSSGASEQQIIDRLHSIETERMGLRGDRSRLVTVTRKLLAVNINS